MTEEMDRIMRKMKSMGVTISTTSHPGASFEGESSPTSVIGEYARKHGIHYDSEES